MGSEIRRPKRAKRYYEGKALIYQRQYDWKRKKSVLYQQQLFYSFGPELGLINSLHALSMTVARFNEQYQDTLTDKHGLTILLVKHYVTAHKVQSFTPEELRTFYDLSAVLGWYVKGPQSFRFLINDLNRLDFCNPLGKGRFVPTTRIKVFTAMYESILKGLLETAQD